MSSNTSDKLRLLHVKQAAVLLDVDPTTVRRAIARGELEALTLGARGHYRIRPEAIEAFLRPVGGERS
jgi:excisionase family DNA binding protein